MNFIESWWFEFVETLVVMRDAFVVAGPILAYIIGVVIIVNIFLKSLSYISDHVKVTRFKRLRTVLIFPFLLINDCYGNDFWSYSFTKKSLGLCFTLGFMGIFVPSSFDYPVLVIPEIITFLDLFPIVIAIGMVWEIGGYAYNVFMRVPKIIANDLYKIFFSDIDLDEG